jgi:hypothetical protein
MVAILKSVRARFTDRVKKLLKSLSGGTSSKIVDLDVSKFGIDDSDRGGYQRSPADRHALGDFRDIIEAFSMLLFGVLTVTQRADGTWWIIDGAGRAYVYYKILHKTGKLPCIVIPAVEKDEEAAIFVYLNKARKTVNSGDMFKAEVAARDPEAVAIHNTMSKIGMTVGRSTKPSNIASVQSVKTILRENGGDTDALARVAALKKNVWPKEICGGGLFEALDLIFRAAPTDFNEKAFRHLLETKCRPGSTLGVLRDHHHGRMPLKRYIPVHAAVYWADEYNLNRKKGRLSKRLIEQLAGQKEEKEAA